MVTPPALPSRSTTLLLASTVRVWLGSSVPEKRYFPSVCARTQTGSSAVTSTRTWPLVLDGGTGAGGEPEIFGRWDGSAGARRSAEFGSAGGGETGCAGGASVVCADG